MCDNFVHPYSATQTINLQATRGRIVHRGVIHQRERSQTLEPTTRRLLFWAIIAITLPAILVSATRFFGWKGHAICMCFDAG